MKLIISFLFLIFSFDSFAEEKNYIDLYFSDCVSKYNSNAEMKACTVDAYEKWEDYLDKSYSYVLSIMNEEQKDKMIKSHDAWIKYRDLEAENIISIYSSKTGQLWELSALLAIMNITKKRAMDIDRYSKDIEDD